MSCAIIACLKQEELYIKEWLDWHIKIGIDHFYLCDNNDKDYQPKLQDIIQEYIDKGIVEIFDYNNIHPIQPICYNNIYQKYRNLYDWWLIIDIDEFLFLPAFNDNIKEYIKIIPKYINHILIMWKNYGDNNLIKYDNRGCLERFIEPLNKYNTCCKSLFKKDNIYKIEHQHLINHSDNKYDVFFNYFEKYGTRINISKNYELIYNHVYLKHFRTKSLEEWIWRNKRGDTLKDKDDKKYPYKLDNYWKFNVRTPEKEKFLKEYESNIS